MVEQIALRIYLRPKHRHLTHETDCIPDDHEPPFTTMTVGGLFRSYVPSTMGLSLAFRDSGDGRSLSRAMSDSLTATNYFTNSPEAESRTPSTPASKTSLSEGGIPQDRRLGLLVATRVAAEDFGLRKTRHDWASISFYHALRCHATTPRSGRLRVSVEMSAVLTVLGKKLRPFPLADSESDRAVTE